MSKAEEIAAKIGVSHYQCEDTYYQCPQHPEGGGSGFDKECDCGYDERKKRIVDAINDALEWAAQQCDDAQCRVVDIGVQPKHLAERIRAGKSQ